MKTRHFLHLAAALLGVAAMTPADAVPTVSGRPVPELTDLDDMMTNFMDANGITAGLLGVSQNGRIVYLRSFGDDFDGDPLQENALVRIASLTKPITAAVTRELISDGEFALGDNAFDVGQAGGGVLDCVADYPAFPSLWNPNAPAPSPIAGISINHLLLHQGGWDRGITPDITYRETQVASEMAVASPPGRVNTMRWILGQPLEFTPGSQTVYSNVGYFALGLIAEEVTGQSLISYIRGHILTPNDWVPNTEILAGGTFRSWQNPREPKYDDTTLMPNVFDGVEPEEVEYPYGGWHHEARVGQGNLVLSAATYLNFADRYRCSAGSSDSNTGQPLATNPVTSDIGHTGSCRGGTNTAILQRTDGVNVFIFFNKTSDGTNYARTMRGQIDTYLDNNVIPAIDRSSDGFWTLPSGGIGLNSDFGGYDRPFHSFGDMLANTGSGSKIRLKPGSSDWTGTIGKRRRFDAPLGPVTIGK